MLNSGVVGSMNLDTVLEMLRVRIGRFSELSEGMGIVSYERAEQPVGVMQRREVDD